MEKTEREKRHELGTYYKYNGYLRRIGKNEIAEKREECVSENDMLWHEILAYMAMTPPAYAKDEEGHEYPWAEFIAMKLSGFREAIEENARLIARLDDCDEAIRENPDDVSEG